MESTEVEGLPRVQVLWDQVRRNFVLILVTAVFLGGIIDCQVQVGMQSFHAKLSVTSDLGKGDRVYLCFSPKACVILAHD